MESSQSNIRDGSAGGSGGEGGDGGGGGGGDVAWLSSISEAELDFLISLKELIVRRAKTIGHKYLADKFDVKMLRALGIVLLEYFKEHAESACAPKLAETLALFNGCGSGTQPSHANMVVSESMQASSFMTPRRKRMWEGKSMARVSLEEVREEEKTREGKRWPRRKDEAPQSAAKVTEGDARSMRNTILARPMLVDGSQNEEQDEPLVKDTDEEFNDDRMGRR